MKECEALAECLRFMVFLNSQTLLRMDPTETRFQPPFDLVIR